MHLHSEYYLICTLFQFSEMVDNKWQYPLGNGKTWQHFTNSETSSDTRISVVSSWLVPTHDSILIYSALFGFTHSNVI